MAELGLLGLPLPAEFGGFGGGAVDAMGVMEAIGAALIVEPYLPTVGLGAQFVARAGTAAQKERILPAVVAGDLTLAFAQLETDARYDLAHVATRAASAATAAMCSTAKSASSSTASTPTSLVVSARTGGEVARRRAASAVFLVDAQGARGLACAATARSTGCARRTSSFDGVRVAADALVGDEARRAAADRGGGRLRDGARLRGGGRRHRLRQRRDARVPEDAQAVRRAHRLVPGAAAPDGRSLHRARAGEIDGEPRVRERWTREADRRGDGSASYRRRRSASPTPAAA